MPEGDTVCDKVAIKLGFSIYDEYIKGILINAYNILSYVVNDNVFKYYLGESCNKKTHLILLKSP